MFNFFKSQVKPSSQIKLSESHHLWKDLSLEESSSIRGGWKWVDADGLVWRCRYTRHGTTCTHRETGVD